MDVLPHGSGHFEEICVGELVRGPGSVSFRLSLLLYHTGCYDVVEDVVERKRFAGMVARCGTTLGTVTGAGFGDAHDWRMSFGLRFLYVRSLMENRVRRVSDVWRCTCTVQYTGFVDRMIRMLYKISSKEAREVYV